MLGRISHAGPAYRTVRAAPMMKRICFVRQSIYPDDLLFRREVETVTRAGFETHVISLAAPSGARSGRGPEIIDGVHVHRLPLRR